MSAERLTKKSILSWHVRAKRALELRRTGRLRNPIRRYLSKDDEQAYSRSIDRHFNHLKAQFNAQLEREKKEKQNG